jgi:hypothetical protein
MKRGPVGRPAVAFREPGDSENTLQLGPRLLGISQIFRAGNAHPANGELNSKKYPSFDIAEDGFIITTSAAIQTPV